GRRVRAVAAAGRASAQAPAAALLLTGSARVWQLACVVAIYGAADAFFAPASVGLVSETVDGDRVQEANALLSLPASVSSVVCPVLAGVLVVAVGAGVVFALDAATFAVSAATLPAPRRPGRRRPGAGAGPPAEPRRGWARPA